MISQRYLALSLLGLSSAFSVAGESLEPVNSISQTKTPDFMEKIKFSGDIRSRYEARDEDTFDAFLKFLFTFKFKIFLKSKRFVKLMGDLHSLAKM